jgi:hypothetical protein
MSQHLYWTTVSHHTIRYAIFMATTGNGSGLTLTANEVRGMMGVLRPMTHQVIGRTTTTYSYIRRFIINTLS